MAYRGKMGAIRLPNGKKAPIETCTLRTVSPLTPALSPLRGEGARCGHASAGRTSQQTERSRRAKRLPGSKAGTAEYAEYAKRNIFAALPEKLRSLPNGIGRYSRVQPCATQTMIEDEGRERSPG